MGRGQQLGGAGAPGPPQGGGGPRSGGGLSPLGPSSRGHPGGGEVGKEATGEAETSAPSGTMEIVFLVTYRVSSHCYGMWRIKRCVEGVCEA